MKRVRRWSVRLDRLTARLKGWRIYAIALLAALPDILNALGAVDFTALGLAPGLSIKVSGAITLLRLMLPLYLEKLRRAREQRR